MSLSAEELGRQRALLFQGFAYFAHRQALNLDLETLFFVTREGVFFKAVYESLFSASPGSVECIDTRLLEASRQSTFGPSLAAAANIDLSRLWNLYPRITPRAFLKSLNLDELLFGEHFMRHGVALDELVDQPWENTAFQRVIGDPVFQRQMRFSLERDKDLALTYFWARFGRQKQIGIVEIGWQGSIQDNLALLFPQKKFVGFYLGLATAKTPIPPNSSKLAFGPDRNQSAEYRALLNAVNVPEFICLSVGGSVARYVLDDTDTVVPKRSINALEDQMITIFSIPFQRGVVLEGSDTRRDDLTRLWQSGKLKRVALSEWKNILKQPHPELVKAYFALRSNEEFGMGEFRDQAQTPTWKIILAMPFSKAARLQLIRYLTYSQWADGLKARKDMGHTKRWVLYVLMQAAIFAKPLVQKHRGFNRDRMPTLSH